MALKLILNVLYTVGIAICVFIIYSGFNHKRYDLLVGAVMIGAALIVLKLRLLKQVRAIKAAPKK